MKKTLKVFFSLMIILAVAASVISVTAASASGNKTKVYKYLTDKLSFNSAAACGIMANIEHESKFDPTIVARDSNGLLSGGLCMWNGSRFRSLKSYCGNKGYNYLSIAGQLEYLSHELKSSSYKHIYNYLKNVPDNSKGAADAAYYWCYYFEVPGNRSYQSQRRSSSAASTYWPEYGNTPLSAPKITSGQNEKKVDIDKSITVKIDKANDNSTGIIIKAAKKSGSSYDWKKAKTFSFSKDKTSVKIPANKLGVGEYAIKAYSYNSNTDKKSSASNTLKFSIVCSNHKKKLTETKEPTFKSTGSYTYVCQKCGLRETVVKDRLSKDKIEKSSVQGLKASKKTVSSITLSWKRFAGADSYQVFKKVGNEWVKLKTLENDKLSYTAKDLKSSTKYTFKVVALFKNADKTYRSAGSTITASTNSKSGK